MRTIRTKVYTFNELSENAKQTAIEEVRNLYYEYNDFASWAIDDCALFEPKHQDLEDLFGSYLDCEKAMEITNKKQFLLWLGIDTNIKGLDEIEFSIFTPNYRNVSTVIDFDNYSSDFDDVIYNAENKFKGLIQDVLKRIEADIDYRFTDEAITEDIEANEYEFLYNGKKY